MRREQLQRELYGAVEEASMPTADCCNMILRHNLAYMPADMLRCLADVDLALTAKPKQYMLVTSLGARWSC